MVRDPLPQPKSSAAPAPGELPDVIRAFRQRRRTTAPSPRCDFCADELPNQHQHVLDTRTRRLYCACRACYLLFTSDGAGAGHLRAVPDRLRAVPDTDLARIMAEAICGPVQLGFAFVSTSRDAIVTCYPNPHGVAESTLPPESTVAVALRTLLIADVEAVLCWRHAEDVSVYLAPIDVCYELVGRLRTVTRGRDLERTLMAFFDDLRTRIQGSS
ncbi:MAG: DUF5947 family protein [Thermomicrobium sp.]|nr:DUF5947 family protein [Thermomicrobium sp.]MDW7982950.1 DUF5947 family protein [Thermomicrobium sp.]